MKGIVHSAIPILLACIVGLTNGQILRPSNINVAAGKPITATSTCGVGVSEPELYCKLASVPGKFGIKGLECDRCNPLNYYKDRNIRYAVDGSERWWQSPPLSRGKQFQKVNITIDLRQEYQVAYVVIKTGNAPRPGVWSLLRSVDGGRTFTPWHHFATSRLECRQIFNTESQLFPTRDDFVQCSTDSSSIPPFENGEIHISLAKDRPGAANFSFSPVLQEWTKATHIRLQFLRVKTLLADLLPLAREDPTVTRRYFYSIKDISVGAICMCNGHAEQCVESQSGGKYEFMCRCRHNTCGARCDKCCPFFVQKKWSPGKPCEACNCHQHSSECRYDAAVDQAKQSLDLNNQYEGGGVCINCQHNTAGINCEQCKQGYYNPTGVSKTSPNACRPCNCNERFSSGRCYPDTGNCECVTANYGGPRCDRCSEGYYGFPDCRPCDCNPAGTTGRVCGPTGNQCPCKPNYAGSKCDRCAEGYYGYPECKRCNCDTFGSFDSYCRNDGQCRCRQSYTGRQCNQCKRGFYSFPNCKSCNCDSEGTGPKICDPIFGRCICHKNFAGERCNKCNNGYFSFPDCRDCACSKEGSTSESCDRNGRCKCKVNYLGARCDNCQLGFYDYPRCIKCACDLRGADHKICDRRTGQCTCKGSYRGLNCNQCRSGYYGFPTCKACQCNPDGIKRIPGRPLGDCSYSNTGQCDCKDNVQGQECSECKPGFYNLRGSNPKGCTGCYCNLAGVAAGLANCDERSGQCTCKQHVTGIRCQKCKVGYFGLAEKREFGCKGCNCDVGGSYDQLCDAETGQCNCRPNVEGLDCSRPKRNHYYPDLLSIKAETEDACVPIASNGVAGRDVPGLFQSDPSSQGDDRVDCTPVRFSFDETEYPGFSWRGYVGFTNLQKEFRVTLEVPKTGRYHVVFNYILNQTNSVKGQIDLSPRGQGSKQSSSVTFTSTQVGSTYSDGFAIAGERGQPSQFMLTQGTWDLTFSGPLSKLLLDYISVVPQQYYTAEILERKINNPCVVNSQDPMCVQYSYISTVRPDFPAVELETGYIITRQGRQQTHVFDDKVVLDQLDFNVMAYLDRTQTRVTEDIKIPKPGNYVLILQYYHPSDEVRTLDVYLRSRQTHSQRGTFYLHSCRFKFGCRQVALDEFRRLKIFKANEIERRVVTLLIGAETSVAVDSITAIPVDQWNLDYVVPRPLCTTKDKKCIPTSYPVPKGAVVFDATADKDSKPPPNILDPSNKLKFLKGPAPLDLVGPIPKAGKYSVVVHYYQPNFAKFTSRATVTSDRAIPGSIDFEYCPNVEGCRAVIHQYDRSTSFDLGRLSASVQLDIPRDKSVWVDYAMLMPHDKYSQEVVDANPVSFSKDFLSDCAKNSYFIKPYAPETCKKPVFSLVTEFNNGTLPCNCDAKGSIESGCNKFGGKCRCRPNVIGRKCNKCKTGYYGFPNCYKCKCVFCNEVTGACDCPANTVGPNCGLCLKGTYGYDPIQGCKDCKCDITGVTGSDVSCDAATGQCPCKPSRTGSRCNKCAVGRYGYPYCNTCDCDGRGVLNDICDVNGVCLCKPRVVGKRCDKCYIGHYNLNGDNPNGCTACWCSGYSKVCKSALLQRTHIRQMKGWMVENTRAPVVQHTANHLIVKVAGKRIHEGKPIYWVAPKDYTGNKVYSYGGQLRYSIQYNVPIEVTNPVLTIKPDVIIRGRNGLELNYKKQLKLAPKVHNIKVHLLELFWTVGNVSHASRGEFMSVLVDIESIKLRGSYSTSVDDIGLLDVQMDYSARIPGQQSFDAKEVEQCVCPPKAAGSSCEKCGKYYTRGADNKTCVPCQCHGHSKDCHPETGECYNCLHNTTGVHCQTCEKGLYGNPKSGSPNACKVCECPLSISSNSFASECKLDAQRRLQCICHKGYTGEQCDQCADGYYGDPRKIGDTCKPCMCNGNIDPSAPDSCDPFTGKCTQCINKAVGDHCERCHDGYYGDAVVAKNCQKCQCDACGAMTTLCNYISGACQCKKNVVGSTCNTCKPSTWNFDSCLGCEDCKCSNASIGSLCNIKTGQCACKPGAIGRRCDRCQAGYWNFKATGCQACECPGGPENLWGFCDVNTGQCCKPGGNCTICPPNYILTRSGCEYCGECVGRLLNTATGMDKNITRVLEYLKKGAAGVIAEAKFRDLNDTLHKLIPPTNAYSHTMDTMSVVVGISIFNGTAIPVPYARYPFSKKTAGKDTSKHSRPEAVLSKTTYIAGPNGPDSAVTLGGKVKDEYIEIENNGQLNPPRSTSILLWVQHSGQVGPIIDFGFKKFRIWLDENNAFEMNIPTNSGPNMLKTLKAEENKWHHIAVTYDYNTGMARFFLNEKLADESNIGRTGVDMSGTELRIGTIPNLYDYFAGAISCLQIFDESLTTKQIAVLKKACSPDFVQPVLSTGKSLLQRSKESEKKTNEMEAKASMLNTDAKESSNNAAKSKDQALILEEDIRNALNKSRGIINLASGIADNLKSGSVNQSLLLKEAESILKELQNRDFTALNNTVNKELETIETIAGSAKMLLNETLGLHHQAAKAKEMIDKLKKEFMGLLDTSLQIIKNASMAEQWNEKSKTYDSLTPIIKAKAKKKVLKESLKIVQQTLSETSSNLMKATQAFENFNGSFARLDDLIRQVYDKFKNLNMVINDLQPWADRAANRSEVLRKSAQQLKDILADTEQFSEKAINASKVYSNIATKLKEALAIARQAEGNATEAQEKSKVVNSRAKMSNKESQKIHNDSLVAKDRVEGELQDLLNNLKDRIEKLKKKIMAVEDDLGQLNDTFDEMAKYGDMGQKALSAHRNASESHMVANDAYGIAVEIEGQLPGLQDLRDSIKYANQNISETEKAMTDAVNKSLNIKERVVVIKKKQTRILNDLKSEVLDVIKEIQDMISESHNLFQGLDDVMDFTGETVTNVLPPPIARDSSSFKDIELFIKPYVSNALLLYFGSTLYEKKSRQRRRLSQACEQDFISLELKDSRVVAMMCVSKKLATIISAEKLQTFVKEDTTTTVVDEGDLEKDPWYKIHFNLVGGTATLEVGFYADNKKEIATYATQTKTVIADNVVYRVDKTNSYLLIGGIPNGVNVPPEVTKTNYQGPLDGLRIDYVPVGLWDAEKLIKPSIFFERRAFKKQEKNIYQFYGKGYIKGSSLGTAAIKKFSFSFKTTASSGLLFLSIADDSANFMMVDIFNASVRYSYDMGFGIKTLVSTTLVNDNKFREVVHEEDIYSEKFDFKLGDKFMAKQKRYYEQSVMSDGLLTDYVYFGGFQKGIMNKIQLKNTDLEDFSGCLKNPAVNFMDTKIAKTFRGIFDRTCNDVPARYVTMMRPKSYLALDPLAVDVQKWLLTISFKTKTPTGIILYQSYYKAELVGLGLEEGKVVLKIEPGMNNMVTLTTQKTYNDGKWHFVSVHYNRKGVALIVDRERREDKFKRSNLGIDSNSDLYIGGVAKTTQNVQMSNRKSLIGGTFRDLSFNGQEIDFQNYKKKLDVLFDEEDFPEPRVKDLIIPKTTTRPPQETPTVKPTTAEPHTTVVLETTPTPTSIPDTTMPPTTMATEPTTTEPAVPTTPGNCVARESVMRDDAVLDFGSEQYSHALYNNIKTSSVMRKILGTRTKINLAFRAINPDGILFYATNRVKKDFVTCYLMKGRIKCIYSPGAQSATLVSPKKYNDGRWHSLIFSRKKHNATLKVDGAKVSTGSTKKGPTGLDQIVQFYLGGVPKGYTPTQIPEKMSQRSFPGCIANFTVSSKPAGKPTTSSAKGCIKNRIESGVYFDEGFIVADETFGVGVKKTIMLEIKPTVDTAAIFSVISPKGDYLVLELISGELILRMENGNGQNVVRYKPSNTYGLCDGLWHRIRIVKDGKTVSLTVDNNDEIKNTGKGPRSGADVNNPFYFGGVPEKSEASIEKVQAKALGTTKRYQGCMRSLVVGNKNVRLYQPVRQSGNVYVGGCPAK